jgi:hypothetical protein
VSCNLSWDADPRHCPNCGRATLDDHEALEWRTETTQRGEAPLVSVRELEGPADEPFVRAMLDDAGIDFQIVTHRDDAFGPLVTGARGYGSVMVNEADAELARELLRDVLEAERLPE